jgi:acylphosphatase
MTTYQLTIKGYVQGVGFRFYVEQSAKAAGVTGEVWNDKDGHVLAIVQHQDENLLKAFTERMRNGPGRVDDVVETTIEKESYAGFHVSSTR